MEQRRFAVVSRCANDNIKLPERKTKRSAGYDIATAESGWIWPFQTKVFRTGLKVYLREGEVLELHPRSSMAIKRSLLLITGVIDGDYADNPTNEGEIGLVLYNMGLLPRRVQKGDRIANGIIRTFLTTDDDHAEGVRIGGFGSTGR